MDDHRESGSGGISRRDFLVLSAVTATTLTGVPLMAQEGAKGVEGAVAPGSRVVRVAAPGALQGKKKLPDTEACRVMLDKALAGLTGKGNAAESLKGLFTPQDRVAIKVNCLGQPGMSTNPELVQAVIAGLKEVGIPDNQITVYDLYAGHLRGGRFKVAQSKTGVSIVNNAIHGYGKEKLPLPSGGAPAELCKVLLGATAVINMPVIKDHDLCGVTCSMKNITHGSVPEPHRYHRNNCDPYIAEIYSLPQIKDKVRLIVTDAFRVLYNGGPKDRPSKEATETIYATFDPVAMDTVALAAIEELRAKHKLPPLDKRRPRPSPSTFLATAAKLGLGVNDPARIEVISLKG